MTEQSMIFDAFDPADMEDELRERSENICASLDNAYEHGQDEADMPLADESALLARFGHPKLVRCYLDGRANALAEVA